MNSSPHDAVMIGDNLNTDIKPAKELGMNTIWLNKNNKKNETNIIADAEIRSLNELAI
ncbi:MAG: HAD hydrolase-like protein [Caloramator sp.]|nr:HAD hydrolase-like protein [Caloramator sp.]